MPKFGSTPPGGRPNNPLPSIEQLFQRGLQQHKDGQYAKARQSYVDVLAKQPDHFGATYLLGLLYHQIGNSEDANTYITKATVLDPNFFEAHSNLGNVLQALGRFDDAIKSYQTALEITPDSPETTYNLGNAYAELEHFNEAIACYRRALHLRPDYAKAHNNLGKSLESLGQLIEALASYNAVIELNPADKNAHFNFATVLEKQKRKSEAERSYRRALEIDPNYVEALGKLGKLYRMRGQFEQAIKLFDKAISIQPHLAELHGNKGNALRSFGRTTDAIDSFEQALALDPEDASAHGNLIFTMGYTSENSPADIYREAMRWNAQHAYKGQIQRHSNNTSRDRQLRVGMVSGDLNDHPVSSFLCGILPKLDRQKLDLVAYSNSDKDDEMTARLKPNFTHWRNVTDLEDQHLADLIRTDAIDILIDLSGHTAGNRLRMFTYKPAPVQITWLGYCGTTGIGTMDYVLCDRHLIPSEDNVYFSESPWHMPDVWASFTPPSFDVEVSPLPALKNGFVTFASFNNIVKVTDQTVACWARILKTIPDSRLVLKALQLDSTTIQDETLKRFEAHGVASHRLTLKGRTTKPEDHLADYHDVDIALDPVPYAGVTTSVEAFWMGVPVLAKQGDGYVSRMGGSLSHCVGLEDWVACSLDDYVGRAQAFASDARVLSALRKRLRAQMLASPLCNSKQFSRNFEDACRGMWQKWCDHQAL